MRQNWTDEEIEKLKNLIHKKYTKEEIINYFSNRTYESIINLNFLKNNKDTIETFYHLFEIV